MENFKGLVHDKGLGVLKLLWNTEVFDQQG